MGAIDKDSHEALRTLLADLISEPIKKSIDGNVVPELTRSFSQLATLSSEHMGALKDIKTSNVGFGDAIEQVQHTMEALQHRLGDEAIGADLQDVKRALELIQENIAAVRALQNEEAARKQQDTSADRLALLLTELGSLKRVAMGALIASFAGLAGVVWLLLH